MTLVGTRVAWRHRMPDGTRVRDLVGEVVAVSAAFKLLILNDFGTFEECEAKDVQLSNSNSGETPADPIESSPAESTAIETSSTLGSAVDAELLTLGFGPDHELFTNLAVNTTDMRVIRLLNELVKELTEAADQHETDEMTIDRLTRERDAAPKPARRGRPPKTSTPDPTEES